jgi:hypothetical protein
VSPSAALEYAALVLVRPAGPLHHSVNGDLRGGRQLRGRGSLLVGSVVVRSERRYPKIPIVVSARRREVTEVMVNGPTTCSCSETSGPMGGSSVGQSGNIRDRC